MQVTTMNKGASYPHWLKGDVGNMTTTNSRDGLAMLMRGKSTTCRTCCSYFLRVFDPFSGHRPPDSVKP